MVINPLPSLPVSSPSHLFSPFPSPSFFSPFFKFLLLPPLMPQNYISFLSHTGVLLLTFPSSPPDHRGLHPNNLQKTSLQLSVSVRGLTIPCE